MLHLKSEKQWLKQKETVRIAWQLRAPAWDPDTRFEVNSIINHPCDHRRDVSLCASVSSLCYDSVDVSHRGKYTSPSFFSTAAWHLTDDSSLHFTSIYWTLLCTRHCPKCQGWSRKQNTVLTFKASLFLWPDIRLLLTFLDNIQWCKDHLFIFLHMCNIAIG